MTRTHGELTCTSTDRFTCMVCWAEVCWCYGCADQVDDLIEANRQGRGPECGICDGCWSALSGAGELVAYVEEHEQKRPNRKR